MEKKTGYMYPNESEYYAKILSNIEGYTISMLDIKHDGRGVWAVSNNPEPGKEYTIFNMPRRTSGIIPREIPYKEGTYKTWEDLEKEAINAVLNEPKPKNPIGLIAVNHFRMDKVENDLSNFYKNGVKTLGVELPSDIQKDLDTYLKSPKTEKEMETLGQAWIEKSITPKSIQQAQKTLEEVSGETISPEDMKNQMLKSAENPMTDNTTIKYLIDTAAKAHTLGFKVVCIDSPFDQNSASFDDIENNMEQRNAYMANNISNLANNTKVAAIVGGGHIENKENIAPIQKFLDDKGAKYEIFDYDKGSPEKSQIDKFFGEKPKKNKELIEYMEMQ